MASGSLRAVQCLCHDPSYSKHDLGLYQRRARARPELLLVCFPPHLGCIASLAIRMLIIFAQDYDLVAAGRCDLSRDWRKTQ